MFWKKNSPTADVSILRVELAKAQMRIADLEYTLMSVKSDADIYRGRILRFLDEVDIGSSQDDLWDAIEILRGNR